MIAMVLTTPATRVESTVLITCEGCGQTMQYLAAYEANWIAVGGGPWRYRCIFCRPESLTFVYADDVNQCDGCRRGLPLDELGIHYGEGFDMIACTRERYENPEEVT